MSATKKQAAGNADAEALDVIAECGKMMDAYRKGQGSRKCGVSEPVRIYAERLRNELEEFVDAVADGEEQQLLFLQQEARNGIPILSA